MFRLTTILIFLASSNLIYGSDICSCAPLVYRWKIDFTLSCPPVGLDIGPGKGITNVDCDVVGGDVSVSDLQPIKITSYQLSELDMNLQIFKSEAAQKLSLMNGDIVEFTSETALDPTFYSGGLQAIVDAENELGQYIRLTWILVFSNICEIEPFLPGQSIGWLTVDDAFDKASDSTCQQQSLTPSFSPTNLPTQRPSKLPTKRPTHLPTSSPTRSPTVAPTKSRYKPTVVAPPTSSPTMQSMTIQSVSTTPSLTPEPSVIDAPTFSQYPSTAVVSKSAKGTKSTKIEKVSIKSKRIKSGKSSKKQKSFKAILIESYVPDSRI